MTTFLARRLLLAAIVLGIAGDQLLRADGMYLGFTLWVLGLVAVALAHTPFASETDPTRPREHLLLVGSAGAAALLLVLRDAEILWGVDFFALIVLASLIGWRAFGRPLAALLPRDAITGGLNAVIAAIAGGPLLFTRDAAPGDLAPENRKSMRGFAFGAVLATPLLLVVAILLGSADPVFGAFLERVTSIFDAGLWNHLLVAAVLTWTAAGALRGALVSTIGPDPLATFVTPRLSFATLAPGLIGLVILLSAWIGLQVRVMFGGAEYVATTGGVTVAEYARHGFFELVAVAGIVLGVLLLGDEFADREDPKEGRSFRTAGWALLALVGVMMVSAMQRLALYIGFFGLTDERFLAAAVLIWVALVLAWFGWTVLRRDRTRFAAGVLVLSAAWLLVLNGINPEARIVRTNLERAGAGKSFDVEYHVKLSADALPALLAGADQLPPDVATQLRAALEKEWAGHHVRRPDWRSWSLPFGRVNAVLAERAAVVP